MNTPSNCLRCGSRIDETLVGPICPVCMMRSFLGDDLSSESVPESTPLPRSFGPYELLEEIGRGGMGVVYRARQLALDRVVAVKLLLSGAYSSEPALSRFKTEAEAAARIRHVNAISIHEFGEVDGQPYYAMDFVEGRNLSSLCNARPLETRRGARIFQQVARVIRYSHAQGILHRDLKPSNVLVDWNDVPHVGDFGLAKNLGATKEATLTGQVMGSPGYMAPEQARGEISNSGEETDVYGLGALLYFILTARAPHNAARTIDTLRLVQEEDPPAPRLLNGDVPRDLETICLKCMESEPRRRYPSVDRVVDDVERFLAHRPISARRQGWIYRARKYVRRHRLTVAATSGIFAALAIGLLTAWSGYRKAVIRQHEAQAARAKSEAMAGFILEDLQPQLLAMGRQDSLIASARAATEYYETLPATQRSLKSTRAHARAMQFLADAYGVGYFRFQETNRDADRSFAALTAAMALWRTVCQQNPGDVEAEAALLRGELLLVQTEPGWAGNDHQKLLEDLVVRQGILARREPRDRLVQEAGIHIVWHQVFDHARQGRFEKSIASGKDALRRVDALDASNPGYPGLPVIKGAVLAAIGDTYRDLGRPEPALGYFNQGIAVCEKSLQNESFNFRVLALASTLAMRAVWTDNSLETGSRWIASARDYLGTLRKLDSGNPEWVFRDAMMCAQKGVYMSVAGDYKAAFGAMEEALGLFASNPDELGAAEETWSCLAAMGGYAVRLGRNEAAGNLLGQLQMNPPIVTGPEVTRSRHTKAGVRYRWLYAQTQITRSLEDWAETERLALEMLDLVSDEMPVEIDEFSFSGYRAPADAILGHALLEQNLPAEALPWLERAVARFRKSSSLGTFHKFPAAFQWAAAEDFAQALVENGHREEAVEVLEWALAKREKDVALSGNLIGRIALARCSWQLANTLDPADALDSVRRIEAIERAHSVIDDPAVPARLAVETRDLQDQIADLMSVRTSDVPAEVPGV